MKKVFEILDQNMIAQTLEDLEYGTLALSDNNKPYSIPINFVSMHDVIYFHGSKTGRKMDILKNNKCASFSLVEPYSIIPSFFSSKDELACPATQFFKSIVIDGHIEFVEGYGEKVEALSKLMQKLQKEGGYKPLNQEVYTKAINAVTLYKLVPIETRAKFKFGQNLTEERFEMILAHLAQRGTSIDRATIKLMQELTKKDEK